MPVSHKRKDSKKASKTNKNSNMRKMKGGSSKKVSSSASANSENYTSEDVDKFFLEITKHHEGGSASGYKLSKDFFELAKAKDGMSRHRFIINPKWKNMVNTCYNERGQTPLYVALRFDATQDMIDMLLNLNIDINRPNTDGSIPLLGLCFGKNINSKISWDRTTKLINNFCSKGADISKENNSKETALYFLKIKGEAKLIDYDIE